MLPSSEFGQMSVWRAWPEIGTSSDLVKSPDLLERYVELLGGHGGANYLTRLPALIAEAKEQDGGCAECWGSERESYYRVELDKLISVFQRFHFRPKVYERLIRQPDKPLLRDAVLFMNTGQQNSPEAIELERIVRMRLRDFVLLEEQLSDSCRELDEAREELCATYEQLALRIGHAQTHSDESTIASALVGLRRATAWYDYKRGFSFEEYAQHWIQEAIDKRRG